MAAGTHREEEGPSTDDEALCSIWENVDCDCNVDCVGCPVFLRSLHARCKLTPYPRARIAFMDREDRLPYYQQDLDDEVEYLRETLRMVESGALAPEESR